MITIKEGIKKVKDFLAVLGNKLKSFKLKRDYLVFMGFFMLSMVFWLLKSLNKNYETEIDYPVRFSNKPREVIYDGDLTEEIQIIVDDAGFQLLQNSFMPTLKSLNINVETLMKRRDRKLSEGHYFVLTNDYRSVISKSLASTSRVISISPDTIHLRVSHQVKAKVPVRLLAKVTPGRQRIISGKITFKPDSISIFGSGRIVDTMRAVYTNYQDFKNLQDTLKRNIGLMEIEGIEYSDKRVIVEIPIETFTEKEIKVPIIGKNFPDSIRLRAFPGLADVSFFVGVSRFAAINENDFVVWVDYSQVKGKVSGEVDLSVQSNINWISNIRVKPEKIDYLLELK